MTNQLARTVFASDTLNHAQIVLARPRSQSAMIYKRFCVLPLLILTSATLIGPRKLVSQVENQHSDDTEISASEMTADQEQMLVEYLKGHHEDATQFVVSQFDIHDVVLLGETHQVAENCQFVAALIEPLYRAGVRRLASEFTRSEFNADLEKLVTAKQFDDQLAVDLFRKGPWPTWGFQEYVEILRSAWALNAQLAADAEKFLVIGIESDWRQYDNWFSDLTPMQRMQNAMSRERHLTSHVKQCLDRNDKLLVHIGESHTNTKHGLRMGKVLTDEYGSRVKQVVLHHPWQGKTQRLAPMTNVLERISAAAGQDSPIGFDIADTPLDQLRDKGVIFWQAIPDASLSDFAQSYVYLKPLRELHVTTWIPDFITEERFEEARAIADRAKWVRKESAQTLDDLNSAMQERFQGQLRK